jgi:biopolymer transport protein ExbD
MTFSVRHEGSPRAVAGLSAAEVAAGLRDGRWEPTDEVRADGDGAWVPLEDSPRFAEAVADVQPPPRKVHVDETRLDMNPLIDVALVLLIFFILTTTYETVRKVLDMPGATAQAGKVRTISQQEAKRLTILVHARQKGGQAEIKIEEMPVNLEDLDSMLAKAVADSKKTTILLDATPDVEYGVVVAIMDAARGAGVTKTLFVQPPAK